MSFLTSATCGHCDWVSEILPLADVITLMREHDRIQHHDLIHGDEAPRQADSTASNAIIIQSYFRMIKQRKMFIAQRNAAIMLQIHVRSYQEMKKEEQKFQNTRSAVIKSQSFFRMARERKKYMKTKSSISILQEHVRAWIAKRRDYEHFHLLRLVLYSFNPISE